MRGLRFNLNCHVCGDGFTKTVAELKQANAGKYCSVACKQVGRTLSALAKRMIQNQPEDHKLVALSNGTAKVSTEDYELINSEVWHVGKKGYAMNRQGKMMHRVIMKPLIGTIDGLTFDHINRDPLDNRRENLRVATAAQNMANRISTRATESGYIGVGVDRRRNKFFAYIKSDSIHYNLGFFWDAEEAAYIRDQFALVLHGDFAITNFELKETS